jgi:ATP-dependent DNA helicase RecG
VSEAERGRARLAFDELFFVQILHRRANAVARAPRAGVAFELKKTLTTQLKEVLPYSLTGAQARAIREIFADMSSPAPDAPVAAG